MEEYVKRNIFMCMLLNHFAAHLKLTHYKPLYFN